MAEISPPRPLQGENSTPPYLAAPQFESGLKSPQNAPYEPKVKRAAPTPEEVAAAALAPIYFEWYCERTRAEAAVAEAVRLDRARIRAVADRARLLVPSLLRDLYWELGRDKP